MVTAAARMRRGRLAALVAAVTAAGGTALPAAAHACAVCYGAADNRMIDGTRLSVGFLLGLTYLLLGGGIGMFVLSRRHHRKSAPARDVAAKGDTQRTETHRRADAP